MPVFDTKSISSVEKSDQLEDVNINNECSAAEQCQASTSKGTSFIDDGVVTLLKIFLDHDTETVRRALVQHGRIELAADALSTSSDHNSFTSEKLQKAELSAHDTLKKRKRKMKSALCAERLKIED